jgi:hypothetical protein
MMQDLRYALRQSVRRPGFAAIAVLSLALAIGGNSLIYGLLDGFVLRPFPYPRPDRLVAVGVAFPKLSAETAYVEALSPAEYLDIRGTRSFADTGGFDLGNRTIAGGDVPESVFAALLLDDLFPVIGLRPALGRGFTPEELGPHGPPAAIISHRLWQTRFGADPAILTRTLRIHGRATSVVGVMPPGLVLVGTDLWIPWGGDPLAVPRNRPQFNVLARLAHGASLAQANAELALSVVLLLGAGLLMRSFLNVQRMDRGFDPAGVLTMRLTLPPERYPVEAAGAFFDRLSGRLASLPGVRAVSAASQFPPFGFFDTQFRLESTRQDARTLPTALITVATPGYFDTLRVPLRSGRQLSATDRLDTPPVVLINEALAAQYLPGTNPIGQRLSIGSPDRTGPWATVVGVVADYRNSGVTQPVRLEIYMPVRQQTGWNQQRLSTLLLGICASVALVLAAIGIYGVMSYAVSARRQEMGVRLAIGAQRRDIIWLILGQVLRFSVLGLTIGIAVVVIAGRALEGLLFGVGAADPLTIAIVTLVLGGVALVAAWAPASRACRVDPIQALRCE